MSGERGAQIDTWVSWIGEIARMVDPPIGREQVLTEGRIKSQRSWDHFCRFLIFFACEWGKYGRTIRPEILSITEELGISRSTVRRYLQAACDLGLLRRLATRRAGPSVYEIEPFWLAEEDRAAAEHRAVRESWDQIRAEAA